MVRNKRFCVLFTASIIMLLSVATTGYAKNKNFNSPCFGIALTSNLKLISNTEERNHGFYHYVFASSNNDGSELQMRVIVSNKKPEISQSLEDFQVASIGAMSTMFMDSYKLYQYINTPENQKVLSKKPYKLTVGNSSFAQATM